MSESIQGDRSQLTPSQLEQLEQYEEAMKAYEADIASYRQTKARLAKKYGARNRCCVSRPRRRPTVPAELEEFLGPFGRGRQPKGGRTAPLTETPVAPPPPPSGDSS